MPPRYLVPVDYSERCLAAYQFALLLAAKQHGEVDVVHIWDKPAYVPDTVVVGSPGSQPRSLGELIRENAELEMREFLQRTPAPEGITVTHHLESGEPAATILRTAEATSADTIVLSTHGRTGVRHFLLGSVAEKVVRLSPIPVITVPGPAEPA